jgi:hypothetical protein
VLGLLSFFLFFITSIPGLICGIMGLKRIARSQAGGGGPRLTGRGLAIAGIVLSTITTLASSACLCGQRFKRPAIQPLSGTR